MISGVFSADRRVFCTAVVLAIIAVLLPGFLGFSAEAFEPQEITDDLGEVIELTEAPERIVSLAPSLTEMLYGIGLGDKVVGVTEVCDHPEKMLAEVREGKVDTIGTTVDPNIEKIVELQPDLIMAAGINPVEDIIRLRELDLVVAGFDPADLESTFSVIERTGKMTGYRETTGEVKNEMQDKLSKIEELVAGREKTPGVFYEIWSEPLQTAGADTFIDDMIERAGGRNVGAEAGSGWPQFNLEKLLLADPEVYISTPHSGENNVSAEGIKNREHFSALTAVQEDRVHMADQDRLSRPGPRVIDGLKELVGAVHPQLTDELEDI
ncbi:ABC transporter substrate-binding protein [Halarsenatibacter silvermanii]|uniref:Iron complex transport system substrate-binding protein n=1 Tax=Halarsenatibacter silvermanii TaxID=321763 RepID=A0A1G9I1G8_9FIRM|nr:helical backbone metal receptor [Halarsenatibacter silvermanii]SDL19049.1 iron complex transport system substrate-binding protein [Halarsenatibacter silvermanii]